MPNTDYLSLEDLIEIGTALIPGFAIRDIGLLQSSAARPQTSVYGKDAYKTFPVKAAALMHSLARNHCLVDGNKRLAWAGTRVFCLMNGFDLVMSIDEAEELVQATAQGKLDVPALSTQLIKHLEKA